ncbi:di-heme oxidoredictase family protein [Pelistega suis]|uniref:C-type cytochrome n=1 Tax=Pelistega suis TaxID=1631957 RepID=A0A849P7E6_9BURK|nr:di-heme oxidoredictase family protein [Pelistega suis]NOL52224.1 c-type cytochrome [Pelistega suis]
MSVSVSVALADDSQSKNAQEDLLLQGRSFFHVPWVAAPSSTTARDGLGPLFNANTCSSCHLTTLKPQTSFLKTISTQDNTPPIRHFVLKLSQPHVQKQASQITTPDPVYGYQIAINAISSVSAEAKLSLQAKEKTFTFTDGTILPLRHWQVKLNNFAYGPLASETRTSLRIAPTLMGLSFIESIPEQNLIKSQQQQEKEFPLLAGRLNTVYHPANQQQTIGRFGWKASQADLITQTADAAFHDMGLTSIYYPTESCTPTQTDCLKAPQGRSAYPHEPSHDLTHPRLIAIAHYTANLALPKAIKTPPEEQSALQKGQALFKKMQCIVCHQAEQKTSSGEVFFPYSDFLLHDLGEELADHRPEFMAKTSEWRTTPLWRNRYKTHFLHDGRARTLLEAIAWHGGQAASSRELFKQLSPQEREALIIFLESL